MTNEKTEKDRLTSKELAQVTGGTRTPELFMKKVGVRMLKKGMAEGNKKEQNTNNGGGNGDYLGDGSKTTK